MKNINAVDIKLAKTALEYIYRKTFTYQEVIDIVKKLDKEGKLYYHNRWVYKDEVML